jgi:hypothetical protein
MSDMSGVVFLPYRGEAAWFLMNLRIVSMTHPRTHQVRRRTKIGNPHPEGFKYLLPSTGRLVAMSSRRSSCRDYGPGMSRCTPYHDPVQISTLHDECQEPHVLLRRGSKVLRGGRWLMLALRGCVAANPEC